MGAFKKAMLAKQLWRIIANPDSLFSRTLKQKYFPNSNVFQTVARPRSSYTWRSILATRDMIIAGTRWHIGSGQNVLIWTDRWIPQPLSFQVITVPSMLPLNATAAELLDEEGEWKEALIRAVFRSKDVETILGITTIAGGQDQLRWHYEKHGRYSIQSVYRLISQGMLAVGQAGLMGSMSYNTENWRFIWRANVPPKVRFFKFRITVVKLPLRLHLDLRILYS
ncbi:UNVERIFIED_CONTAM: hypothetical protein Sradi_4369300 [Sesamum radiatum]|uniref:Uncharacterized protein n=1 Tax=Sesamum radiatum TaxID=300843 RepID=A0AAW2NPD3_SESRA